MLIGRLPFLQDIARRPHSRLNLAIGSFALCPLVLKMPQLSLHSSWQIFWMVCSGTDIDFYLDDIICAKHFQEHYKGSFGMATWSWFDCQVKQKCPCATEISYSWAIKSQPTWSSLSNWAQMPLILAQDVYCPREMDWVETNPFCLHQRHWQTMRKFQPYLLGLLFENIIT